MYIVSRQVQKLQGMHGRDRCELSAADVEMLTLVSCAGQAPMHLGAVYGGHVAQAAYRPVRLVHAGLAGPEDALRAAAVAQARAGAGAGGGVKEMVC